MPSLKALRIRINSVRSTQKMTSAMKMVAASKLRRAQVQAEAARPYAERMERMLAALALSVARNRAAPRLLIGSGSEATHLIVAMTADRGLCGAFNSNVGRTVRTIIRKLESEGRKVKIFAVGRKGRDYLRREFADRIVADVNFAGRKRIEFADAAAIAERIGAMLQASEFDVCTIVYNRFRSVISQVTTETRLIPAPLPEAPADDARAGEAAPTAAYEFEPDQEDILSRLLPRNLAIQLYRALLESSAGEQGARMSAMDSATRNAGDMINRLTLNYNRTRQANITKELIEIISGAEAM
ncbi:MAG: F0F1 ATP synthase subunit gamma [Acetobacteraceae bacterium]